MVVTLARPVLLTATTPARSSSRYESNMDYAALRKEVVEAGLLRRQYGYYAYKISLTVGLLALSYLLLATIDNFAFQLFNAAFLAFAIVQIGYVMHDALHMQIFRDKRNNELAGVLFGSLTINSSTSWADLHLKHHRAPNHVDLDPDVNMPVLAFSEEQALSKKGIAKFFAKHQAFFWFPLLTTVAFIMRFGNTVTLVKNLRSKRWKFHIVEAVFLFGGATLYFGLIFNFLNFTQAIIFLLVNHVLTGVYMGTSFATNHKAMPLLKQKLDFLHMQVLTARNVKSNPVTDIWYGGLNYQIEHHLFPSMPRNNYGKANKIIKAFCRKNSIEHYETGVFQTYKEILQNFHQVTAILRKPEPNINQLTAAN